MEWDRWGYQKTIFRNLIKSFDCSTWKTTHDFHADVYRQLDFPAYYGKNMDAFNDCMWGVPVPDIDGMTILFHHFDQFQRRFQNGSRIILEILAAHIFRNITYGKRLLVLIQIDDHIFDFFTITNNFLSVNQKEFQTIKYKKGSH